MALKNQSRSNGAIVWFRAKMSARDHVFPLHQSSIEWVESDTFGGQCVSTFDPVGPR
jgi:hypothetical protein